jgi:uncharacterized protein YndB with AHSA1/START domain
VQHYSFRTAWVVDALIERVWDTMADAERWPEWWRGVEDVTIAERGDADRVGELLRFRWRSPMRYRVEFELRTTRVERPFLCEARATGDLAGDARWRLFESAAGTALVYDWAVETTERWMNVLAPLARPVFTWNHDRVMAAGEAGLARRLAG